MLKFKAMLGMSVALLGLLAGGKAHAGWQELEPLLESRMAKEILADLGVQSGWRPSVATNSAEFAEAESLLARLNAASAGSAAELREQVAKALEQLKFAAPSEPDSSGSFEASKTSFLEPDGPAELRVRRLSPGTPLEKAFPSEKRTLILVTDKGNFSLLAGNRRFTGKILEEPALSDVNPSKKLSPGIWIEFKDLPEENWQALRERLEDLSGESIGISCANEVCLALKDSGVLLGGSDGRLPVFRMPTLKRILGEGFKLPDGKPLKTEVWLNYEKSADSFFRRMEAMDRAMSIKVKASIEEVRQGAQTVIADHGHQLHSETRERIIAFIQNGVQISMFAVIPYAVSRESQDESATK